MPRRHASDLRPRGSALNPANTGSNAKPSAQPSNGGVRNLVHVIGGGIDRGTSTERRKRCQEFFAGLPQASGGKLRVKCLVHPTPSDVANAAPSADILHLDCHGKRNPLRLHITDTSADKSLQLTPELVETGEVSVKPGSLVFGNACESGAAEPSWDGPQSFGWSFCRGGARAYIGTLGTVPTDEALNFSHRFYQIFVGANSEHPNPEGDILKAFRAAKTSNPFNLLYCLFCNPLMLQADRSCAESA